MSPRPRPRADAADEAPLSVERLVVRARDEGSSIHERHSAFSLLVARFEAAVFTTARHLCDDSESARDACQEAFLQAWRSLPTLREPSAFGVWIKRLARSHCARARRRRSATMELTGIAHAGDLASGEGDVAQELGRRETEDVIRRAVQRLPAGQREAVILFYFLGESLDGVARALGITAGNAGKRIHEARLQLRRTLPSTITERFLDASPSPSFARSVEQGVLDEFAGEYRFAKEPDRHLLIRREGNLFAYYEFGRRLGTARKVEAHR